MVYRKCCRTIGELDRAVVPLSSDRAVRPRVLFTPDWPLAVAPMRIAMGPLSGGSKRTAEFAAKHGKPWLHVVINHSRVGHAALELRWFIRTQRIRTLNGAGTRGSKEPELHRLALSVIQAVLNQSRTGAKR